MNDLYTLYFENSPKLLHMFKMGVVIDTRLLILYVIGILDNRNNTDYLKKLNYSVYDFDTFIRFKEQMKINRIIVTPNILTEFFNQVENKIGSWFFPKYYTEIKPFIKDFTEMYYNKNEIINIPKFGDFDFTDLSIYLASKKDNCHLITQDRGLSQLCKENEKILTIHFDEIRNLRRITSKN